MDKKISELQPAEALSAQDLIAVVQSANTSTKKATLEMLIALIGNANEVFLEPIDPSPADGKNKDVWMNVTTGSWYKKQNGGWVKKYTAPNGGGSASSSNRVKSLHFVDSLATDNERYEATTNDEGSFVLMNENNEVLMELGMNPTPRIVYIPVQFSNDETSGQDSNIQIKVFRNNVQVDERTLFYTDTSTLQIQKFDTISVEAFSVIEEPLSPPWVAGTKLRLDIPSRNVSRFTGVNGNSIIESWTVTEDAPISINAYTIIE